MHLGHLVPLLCLKRFQLAGHKPVALVGGATGLIGDPSFKAAERKLNTTDTVNEWVEKIRKQVSPFLDFDCGSKQRYRGQQLRLVRRHERADLPA